MQNEKAPASGGPNERGTRTEYLNKIIIPPAPLQRNRKEPIMTKFLEDLDDMLTHDFFLLAGAVIVFSFGVFLGISSVIIRFM